MSVEETLKNFLSKSAQVSKDAFAKAGEAVQEFSDKSVVKLDKMKLESQKTKKITDLGLLVYEAYLSGSEKNFSYSDEKAKIIFEEIKDLDEKIKEKEKILSEASDK